MRGTPWHAGLPRRHWSTAAPVHLQCTCSAPPAVHLHTAVHCPSTIVSSIRRATNGCQLPATCCQQRHTEHKALQGEWGHSASRPCHARGALTDVRSKRRTTVANQVLLWCAILCFTSRSRVRLSDTKERSPEPWSPHMYSAQICAQLGNYGLFSSTITGLVTCAHSHAAAGFER